MLACQGELTALSLAKSRGITLAFDFAADRGVHRGLRRFAARVPQALRQHALDDLLDVERRARVGDHLRGGLQAAQGFRGLGVGGSPRGLPFRGSGFVPFHRLAFLRTWRLMVICWRGRPSRPLPSPV